MLYIVERDKPDQALFQFNAIGDAASIGRDKRLCEICLGANAHGVSRVHMKIHYVKRGLKAVLIANDTSTFGTGYNGEAFMILNNLELKVGDELQIGRFYLVIVESPKNLWVENKNVSEEASSISTIKHAITSGQSRLFLLSDEEVDEDPISTNDGDAYQIFGFDTNRKSLNSQFFHRKSHHQPDHSNQNQEVHSGDIGSMKSMGIKTVETSKTFAFSRRRNAGNVNELCSPCKRLNDSKSGHSPLKNVGLGNDLSSGEEHSKREISPNRSRKRCKFSGSTIEDLGYKLKRGKVNKTNDSFSTDCSILNTEVESVSKKNLVAEKSYANIIANAEENSDDDGLVLGMDEETLRGKRARITVVKACLRESLQGIGMNAHMPPVTSNFKRFKKAAQGRYYTSFFTNKELMTPVLGIRDMIDHKSVGI